MCVAYCALTHNDGTAYIHIIMYVYTHAVLCIVCYGHVL